MLLVPSRYKHGVAGSVTLPLKKHVIKKVMKRAFFVFLLTSTFFCYSQSKTVEWINENSYPIKSDSLNLSDLSFLTSELKDKTVVALGEASHGTHEFYFQKGRIIKYLITKLGYRTIGFEFSESAISAVNQYLQDGTGDLKTSMQNFALYKTEEIYKIFEWIKEYNDSQSSENKVSLFGYDDEEFRYDPYGRDKLMAESIISYLKPHPGKSILWAHNIHLAKDTTMARFEAMGSYLKKEYGKDYYALCFDMFKGTVNVLTEDRLFEKHEFTADPNSFSSLFANSKYEAFYLSFEKNPLTGKKNFITNIYSNWELRKSLPIKLGIDFDGLIFIRNTTASIEL